MQNFDGELSIKEREEQILKTAIPEAINLIRCGHKEEARHVIGVAGLRIQHMNQGAKTCG